MSALFWQDWWVAWLGGLCVVPEQAGGGASSRARSLCLQHGRAAMCREGSEALRATGAAELNVGEIRSGLDGLMPRLAGCECGECSVPSSMNAAGAVFGLLGTVS